MNVSLPYSRIAFSFDVASFISRKLRWRLLPYRLWDSKNTQLIFLKCIAKGTLQLHSQQPFITVQKLSHVRDDTLFDSSYKIQFHLFAMNFNHYLMCEIFHIFSRVH